MKWCAWLLMLLLTTAAHAQSFGTFAAQVVAVIDGDTIVVMQDNRAKTHVRLAGIDAPEKTQAYGEVSRDALGAMLLRKTVSITTTAVDEYGRTIAVVTLGNMNINAEQVRQGRAWEYSLHHTDKAMMALQAETQRARRGLWADANPQPPWDYRKAHPAVQDAPSAGPACGKKHYCSQMQSCEEAKFYLTQCRVKTLDKDGDGVPCENLCNPKKAPLR